MLKELGLGALLFIAGDSELGRQAGDALIVDKVGDALEEGGFDTVSLGQWSVGRDALGFFVDFSDVRVRRADVRLTARAARYHPFSSAVTFTAGTLVHGADGANLNWRFEQIDLKVSGWRAIRALQADARGLHSEAGPTPLMHFPLPGTLAAPEDLAELRFAYEDRGRALSVTWLAEGGCAGVAVLPSRAVPLLELRAYLAEESSLAEVRFSPKHCDTLETLEKKPFPALQVSGALTEIFLEELPEAYTYLLR
jgi:hypothetical protein